jgi:hypothetical protein
MLCRGIIAIFSHIPAKHINTLCRYNVEMFNIKHYLLTYGNHQTVTG